MGKRGPKPQPTALRLLRGNPGKRPLNEAEPKFDLTNTRPPKGLSKEGRKKWRDLVGRLVKKGLFTDADRDLLHNYVIAHERWYEAERRISIAGPTAEHTDTNGNIVMRRRPEVDISRIYQTQMYKIASEFGMSPSSRSRIFGTGGDGSPVDPLSEFLGARKFG
jgi:P27 family predicted phage terminase small subunit